MSTLPPARSVLSVALSMLLIASMGAVGPATATPTESDVSPQSDAQSPSEDGANLTAEEIMAAHEAQLESLETLSLTVRSNVSSDSYSSESTSSIWVDFDDEQIRTERSSEYGDTITVRNETGSVTYDTEDNTVRNSSITFADMNPRENGFFALVMNEESELTYEDTAVINGTETYRLDVDTQSEAIEAEHDATVWIDTETYMPVRYDVSLDSDRYSYETTVQFDDVRINETIPDERFSIDVPEDAERPDYSTPDFESYESESELRQNTSQSVPDPELPANYTFDSAYVTDGEEHSSVSLSYTDGDDGSITLSQSSGNTLSNSHYADSDEFENVSVGDRTGYYNEFDTGESNMSILVWEAGDNRYTIYGSVSQSTVVDIAESTLPSD